LFTLRLRLVFLLLLLSLFSLLAGILAARYEAGGSSIWPLVAAVLILDGLALFWLLQRELRPLEEDLLRRQQTLAELRRYAQEVEALYNQAPCGYHSLDTEGRFIRINDTALAWLGYRRDEVLGGSLRDFLSPAGQRLFDSGFEAFKARGWVRDLEVQLLRKDGTVLYALLSAVVQRDEAGKFLATRSTFVDISERKKSEERLAELSMRLQAVLDAATEVSIIATDLQGRITLFNAGAERMLGYRADEMLGRETPWKIHLPAEVEAHGRELGREFGRPLSGFDVFVERARRGGHEEREWTYVRKDGSRLTVNLVVTALHNGDGSVTGFLGIATDVTERNRARERLKMTMAAARIGTWEWDVGSDRTHFSDNVPEILGLPEPPGEMDLAGFLELIAAEDREQVRAAIDAALHDPARQGRYDIEFRGRDPSGQVRWLEHKGRVFRDASGRATHLMGTLMDVTEKRQAAEALRQARDAAESANRAKSSFLASMSHEIRTPLAAIVGMVELLQQGAVSAEQRGRLQTLGTAAESLLSLISDILDVSKIEADKLELEAKPFGLRALLADIVGVLAVPAQRKGLALKQQIAAEVPGSLVGDTGRLRQVLMNLVGNAIKFTERGEVVVSVSSAACGLAGQPLEGPAKPQAAEANLRFQVRDTGIGIPPDKLQRIFQPFEQADESTTRTHGGTGLGLTISARLVERMGGRLTVCSEVGRGSTFSFQIALPVAEDTKTPAGTAAETAPDGPALRVLLAEDNPINQQVLSLMLGKAGHRVSVVDNGRKALEALERERFDLVLMDVQMPEMDGLRCARLIRAREKAVGGHVPIVAVTANALQGERQRCLAAGMDDYLTKPVRGQELHALIERLFGRGGGQGGGQAPVASGSSWLTALKEMGFDHQAVTGLVRTFVETVPGRMETLARAVGEGDAVVVAQTAHKIKGSLMVFSVGPAIEAAARLERLAQQGEVDALPAALAGLEAAVGPLLEPMEKFLQSPPASAS
jgi:PAS domain S-box-containing protein